MNRRLAFIPITGLVLLTLAGCGTTPNANGTNNNQVINSTTNTSDANAVSISTGSTHNSVSNTGNTTPGNTANSTPTDSTTTSQSDYAGETAFINNKGYSVSATTPNATVKTASGETLSAWIGVSGRSAHNQFVFFFLNGKYLGTDTANPSVEITSVKAGGNGIAATYPVYKKNDSFADPTGAPMTITYRWNGSKLVPNKSYPKQFS